MGKKDITAIYESMPAEQIVPMIATTVAVSVLKVLAIAGVILAVKWVVGKIKICKVDENLLGGKYNEKSIHL